ncbi:ABC transporter substrate-binding protein [Rhodococcus sp. IEGM 1379]|uniref:ABC transporter substrate-binding protein n=1 Tax=Rhodococcus sp. IEGM 1379 TaxID=3047086 RepID=UPI0024B74933|nr:ABC transporter substrate-binding protein [Rhodococcus sp. IEGM 1379]MDI9915359.1 ABC transporter substrate-binding protein [Rhodococcus sp. IEGM 1379]
MSSLNPQRSSSFDIMYLHPVYDALINIDESGNFVPGLATQWELSADGRTFDMTLRQGVTFQDGAEFDASAVKKTIDRAKLPESTLSRNLGLVHTVEAVDPLHVRLHLTELGGQLPSLLATESGMIISPNAVDSPDLGRNPVGAGPYKVVSYSTGQVTYETWEGYWDSESVEAPRIKMITMADDSARMRALQSGQLDAAYLRPSQRARIESATDLYVQSDLRTLVQSIVVNTGVVGLDDPRVRRALSLAIDRQGIDTYLQNGGCTPTVQPFIDGLWPHIDGLDDQKDAAFDPDRARALLEEAGYNRDRPLSLTVASPNISQYQLLAELVLANLRAIGIQADLNVMETTQTTPAMREGKFDLMVTVIDVGRPDPTSYAADYLLQGGAMNPGGFHVPGADVLLEQSRRSVDVQDREVPFRHLLKDAFDAAPPVISICAPDNVIGVRKGVQGLVVPPVGAYEFRGVEDSTGTDCGCRRMPISKPVSECHAQM